MNSEVKLNKLQQNISGLLEYQDAALKIQEENLHQQFEFTRTLADLFGRQMDLLEQGKPLPAHLFEATKLLQQHHDETERVSKNFLSQQNEFIELAANTLKQQFQK